MLVGFKFELNMFVAVVFSIPGFAAVTTSWPLRTSAVCLITALTVIAVFLFVAARGSADVLADVRRWLVNVADKNRHEGVPVPPTAEASD